MFPLRRLLLATWSSWFPRAPTAIWHTFLAALSHPVAGDGDSGGPDRLLCHHPPDLSWYREPQESRIQAGESPREQLVQPGGAGRVEEADAGKQQLK